MRRAVEQANAAYQRHGNDPALIAEELGLRVLEEDLKGRLREVYFGDSIVIRRDLPETEKRELIAHAIGHHQMHAGNHLSMQSRVYSFGNYHERQANVFAACLLVPADELEESIGSGDDASELADRFRVTASMIELRLSIRAAMTPAWDAS